MFSCMYLALNEIPACLQFSFVFHLDFGSHEEWIPCL